MSMIEQRVKELRELSEDCKCENEEDEVVRQLQYAADTIESLSKKLAAANMEWSDRYYGGGWILCKKKMPEIGKPVLVCDKQGNVCVRAVTCKIKGKKYWSQCKNDVVAWCELPAPYRP